MKPAPFTYHCPRTMGELTQNLAELENAKILAGGQSLMAMLNLRYVFPDHVIDINRIPELTGITLEPGAVRIGGMTRQHQILSSEVVRTRLPLMAEALSYTGHIQTRSRGTLGGSLCHLDPAAEQPAVCLAYDAVLTVTGKRGSRQVPIEDWFMGYMTPNLEPDELLTAVNFPAWMPNHGYAFTEFARRHGDFAIASVGCLMALGPDGRIARSSIVLAGLDTRPHRLRAIETALAGQMPDAALFKRLAAGAGDIEILSDAYGSVAYRRRLAKVLTERALATAAERAAGPHHG